MALGILKKVFIKLSTCKHTNICGTEHWKLVLCSWKQSSSLINVLCNKARARELQAETAGGMVRHSYNTSVKLSTGPHCLYNKHVPTEGLLLPNSIYMMDNIWKGSQSSLVGHIQNMASVASKTSRTIFQGQDVKAWDQTSRFSWVNHENCSY